MALPGDIREIIKEVLKLPCEIRAPYEQRYWTGSSLDWILASGVRNIIRYKGKLVIKTGCGGGIYKYPPLEPVFTPPQSVPGYTPENNGSYDMEGWDTIYFPGSGGLDVLLCGGNSRIFIVYPDWHVECITLGPYRGEFAGFIPYKFDADDLYVWLWRGYVYKVNIAKKTYEHISNCPETIGGKGGVYREAGGVPYLYLPDEGGKGVWRLNLDTKEWTQFEAGVRFLSLSPTTTLPWKYHAIAFDGKRFFFARSNDCESWDYVIVPESTMGGGYSPRIKTVKDWLYICACQGHVWVLQTSRGGKVIYTPMMPVPWVALYDVDFYEGYLVVGGNELYWAQWYVRDLGPGMISLVPLEHIPRPPAPSYAIIWDSESISAGEYSKPVITSGWTRKTLMFLADADGILTIEVDIDGSDNYKVYDTVSITANTPKWYIFTSDFAKMRLKFDTAATVTAKLYLMP